MVHSRSHRTAPLRGLSLGLPLLALVLSAGCSTSSVIDGRDGGGFFPTARVTLSPDRSEEASEDPLLFTRPSRWTTEAEGTLVDEDFDGFNFQLTELTLGGRIRWNETEDYAVSALVGAAYADATLESDIGPLATDFDVNNVGAYLGLDARYFSSDILTVYGRVQNAWLFSDATSLRGEIGTEIKIGGPVNLLLGYRWWRYVYDEGDLFSSRSDAELLLRGFIAGLTIDF